MAAINGTTLSLYSDGNIIALQKGLNFGWDCDLFDTTNKQSAGWAEHGIGLMNAKIDFTALFDAGTLAGSPATLSAKDLMDKIINSTSLLVAILGGTYPIVGQADLSSLAFEAPMENAMTLAGSLKVNGALWPLSAAMPNLITDPDGEGTNYDTFTNSGTAITSAINAALDASAASNQIVVTTGDVLKCFFYLTLNSGQLPTFKINDYGVGAISNVVTAVEGLNAMTFTLASNATQFEVLMIANTLASNFKTSPIYLFKTA